MHAQMTVSHNKLIRPSCRISEVKKILFSYKRNKVLMNKFSEGVKNLYTENYKTLMKEIEDTNDGKIS
jgi:hypothetical protein